MTDTRYTLAPLSSLSLVSSNTTIQAGRLNRYDATAAALTPPLPALSGLGQGSRLMVQKYDSSANTVTVVVSPSSGDLISNQNTQIVLSRQLELVELMVVNATWEVIGHYLPADTGALLTASNSKTVTGKTLDGGSNTFTNIPVSALGTGAVSGETSAGAASLKLWTGTAAEFAAIAVKDPGTVYVATP